MMAASKKNLDQEPSEIEMLLPWHAAGTLNARDARRVDEALARDPELARQYAAIREGSLANDPRALLLDGIAQVLRDYANACHPAGGTRISGNSG